MGGSVLTAISSSSRSYLLLVVKMEKKNMKPQMSSWGTDGENASPSNLSLRSEWMGIAAS